jgi:hypothetical protein
MTFFPTRWALLAGEHEKTYTAHEIGFARRQALYIT